MEIEIRFRAVESSAAMRKRIARRVHLHLSRFAIELRDVSVRVADVNGPKGGVDKRCRVTVRGRRFALLSVEETSGDVSSAVEAALELLSRAVARELERLRGARRDEVPFGRAS